MLAKEHELFIRQELQKMEHMLMPSSSEDDDIVRRATFCVRNKSIVFEKYISHAEMVYITVQDVRPAMVEVNFLQKTIVCSCLQSEYCRHKLAVLLSFYQYIGSVQDWATAWRAKKSVELRLLADERTPESWMAMADEVLSRLLIADQKIDMFMLQSVRDEALSKLQRFMPFEREWQPLFKLFMGIVVLSRIWQHVNDTSDTNSLRYLHFERFVELTMDTIWDAVDDLHGKSRLFATDPFYDQLQLLLRTFVLERTGWFELRLHLYIMLWSAVLHEKPRRERELAYLQTVDNDGLRDADLTVLQMMFAILLKDEEAMQKACDAIRPDTILLYLELGRLAKIQEELAIVEMILRRILPYLHVFITGHLNPMQRMQFVHEINAIYKGIPLTDEEQMMLYRAFGQFGLQPFSEFLIGNGRFSEWVALHHLNPSSMSYLETCGLKTVLAEDPAVALPLLHVYAMDELRGRSRMNYKQAVKIWKKMKAAAKKAGKTAFFETYMQTIQTQNKRLRALQEEIEKGNL